ncbi:MAG: type II toxin-antitoxin system VapC family toxin [Candidatus Riflebacteria bacterium]|nr:type II toxin-antitoxin system VapC family toxin [Candidatus Riflebacteria bacterium]
MIVVDTNIIAHTWLPSEIKEKIQTLIRIDHDWIAPILWRSEFRSVLSKYIRKGLLSEIKANELAELAEEQMTNREYNVPTKEIISIIKNSKLSAYDSEFVALSKIRKIKMVTLDKEISKEFPLIVFTLEDFIKNN